MLFQLYSFSPQRAKKGIHETASATNQFSSLQKSQRFLFLYESIE
ncbi:hypothetical protein BACCOPRO_01864 [Phocaeicola coprophilus DSM 18228 = JCM 13818]|uniref:Uncharacterized protein n=1 Tax=Phocaeicola coprophilus DSM 18228 = JCM 13818 TaxID=547042 RepID=S0F7L7_9BACT|nr:hypothetical protein BACCOPRO_01864 [Phocaeicola coprophilus DSM 18228 = JCM 13818]